MRFKVLTLFPDPQNIYLIPKQNNGKLLILLKAGIPALISEYAKTTRFIYPHTKRYSLFTGV